MKVFNWLRAPYPWDFEEPKVGFLSDFPGALRLIVSSSYFGWAIIVRAPSSPSYPPPPKYSLLKLPGALSLEAGWRGEAAGPHALS